MGYTLELETKDRRNLSWGSHNLRHVGLTVTAMEDLPVPGGALTPIWIATFGGFLNPVEHQLKARNGTIRLQVELEYSVLDGATLSGDVNEYSQTATIQWDYKAL